MPIWNTKEECLDAEEHGQQQWERLQSTLNRAFKSVPFYRNRLVECGIDPSLMEGTEDLQRIPFTRSEHFGENYPYGLFAVPLRDVVRIHTARGLGLQPTVSGYTRQDLHLWREIMARALTASGVTGADILQIHLDAGLANWGRDYKDGAESIGAGVIPLTLLPPEKQCMVLKDYRTSVLVTTAPAALQLLHHLFRANINANALALKTLILVGEMPTPATRSRLEEEFHVRSWVHYGLSELPGPALAFECEEGQGLHVSEDHFMVEVVHPQTGEPVGDGEEGELVLTTLTTRAFPLIRFRTGDRVRLMPRGCSCGRTLRKMQWLPHPEGETMMLRGVKVRPQQVLTLVERVVGWIPEGYRFFIRQEQIRDYLEVWLEVDERFYSDEIKEMERISQRLKMELEQELGVPVRIRLKEHRSFEG